MGISQPSGCTLCKEHGAPAGLAVTTPRVCSTQGPRGQEGPRASSCRDAGALADALEQEQYLQNHVQVHPCFTDLEMAFPDVAEPWAGMQGGHVAVPADLGQLNINVVCAFT